MEEWKELSEFPNYAVSSTGKVINIKTQQTLNPSINGQGIAKVNLMRDRRMYTRSVIGLVAAEFIPRIGGPYNSLISKDGDRRNNNVENILRRPRWFAMKYHRQFYDEGFYFKPIPFYESISREEFHTFKEPCVIYGLLYLDVINSLQTHEPVFPTRQRFMR